MNHFHHCILEYLCIDAAHIDSFSFNIFATHTLIRLCGEGEICKAVQQGNQVVAECVCNTPLYVFNDFEQKCVPNSCDVPTACAADEVCKCNTQSFPFRINLYLTFCNFEIRYSWRRSGLYGKLPALHMPTRKPSNISIVR